MNSRRLRVLLFQIPRMIRDIIEAAVESTRDLVVVRSGEQSLFRAVPDASADAVIIGFDNAEQAKGLFTVYPRLKVLAVSVQANKAYLYELVPHRKELGELATDSLLNALRPTTRPPRNCDD
jgi:hypothetical protein